MPHVRDREQYVCHSDDLWGIFWNYHALFICNRQVQQAYPELGMVTRYLTP